MLADLDFATAYLDDILLKSKSRKYHAKDVCEVLKKNNNSVLNETWKNEDVFYQISGSSNRREKAEPLIQTEQTR